VSDAEPHRVPTLDVQYGGDVEVLTDRQLNRATLARQLLLERVTFEPLTVVERLVGLQAQEPRDPHIALWSRIDGYRPGELDQLLESRAVVRSVAIRGTVHLLTRRDCLDLWPLQRPVLDAELRNHSQLKAKLVGVDLAEPIAFGRRLLSEPHPQKALRSALAERFPELDPAALALVCRNKIGLVQVPPRGMWKRSHQVTVATIEAWLGEPLGTSVTLADVALRYLAAFGPARAADFGTWSRLSYLTEMWESLADHVVAFEDSKGRTLFDLPNAPRPDADTPAPVRFLPEYDNVLLSHSDRSRFVDRDVSALHPLGRIGRGHVLVDGVVRATWLVTDDHIDVLHRSLTLTEHDEVVAEAIRLSVLLELDGPPKTELVTEVR